MDSAEGNGKCMLEIVNKVTYQLTSPKRRVVVRRSEGVKFRA